ncbi:DUF2892 domain-containing protein [Clostridium sp. MSJ-11]|uniref:DUF2892 domain-containing protein n=1 Tax=Clostridium mobile TaxID=2841512 RepID=A0ABS6EI07_9CLOT|nr:DUF2892 domain-containing protein [Clostridium mobile]MBU5484625.1 DUF2892 domain-containing protein [Clostridium mobile]
MEINSVDIIRELLLKDNKSKSRFIPNSLERVRKNSNYKDNLRIVNDIINNVNYYKDKDEEFINKRIYEISMEWDIERILETHASILILTGLIFGTCINRKWYLLSATAGAFLLQYAIQGWCLPIIPLRKAGVKTPYEICTEIIALKVLTYQKNN